MAPEATITLPAPRTKDGLLVTPGMQLWIYCTRGTETWLHPVTVAGVTRQTGDRALRWVAVGGYPTDGRWLLESDPLDDCFGNREAAIEECLQRYAARLRDSTN